MFMTGCSKERAYENIYEGLKKREQIVNPSNEPVTRQQQSYREYIREREEILQDSEGSRKESAREQTGDSN